MLDRYPLQLRPEVKEVVWGGRWLAETLGRADSAPDSRLGESWEAYSGSLIANGPLAGRTLGGLFHEAGTSSIGEAAARYPQFPLLVKFIEARQNLSLQVHPNDALAQQLENYPYGKTEFWFVLEAAPGAEILYGLTPDVTSREQLEEAIRRDDLLRFSQRVPVRAGDVVSIPAGTIHALTEGVIVYELQQDCNITYRLYDWGRTDRQMHREKGLQAIHLAHKNLQVTHPTPTPRNGYEQMSLIQCDYFQSEWLRIATRIEAIAPPESFVLLTTLDGAGAILSQTNEFAPLPLAKGDTLFLPAGLTYTLESIAHATPLTLIQSRLA